MGRVNVEKQKTGWMRSESTKDKLMQVAVQFEKSPVLPELNHTSILVADDDAFYLNFIEMILIKYNFKIIHAKDGQEAVNIYQNNNDIKLILMDIQMPVMDGLTATKEIRKINPKIPIIANSSYSMNGIQKEAINSGCNEFLSKPVKPEVLSMKIEQYLSDKYTQ